MIYLICNFNFFFYIKFMEDQVFYCQKLAINDNYILLYVKVFIK